MSSIDLAGQRFGRLVAVRPGPRRSFPSGQSHTTWEVLCDCGNTKTILTGNLRRGVATSCGCYQMELRVAVGKSNRRDTIGYYGVHTRLRNERGAAKGHTCADCGGPAKQWSYDHGDPDEHAEVLEPRPGYIVTVRYSHNLDHYQPRCISCHGLMDQGLARTRRLEDAS